MNVPLILSNLNITDAKFTLISYNRFEVLPYSCPLCSTLILNQNETLYCRSNIQNFQLNEFIPIVWV